MVHRSESELNCDNILFEHRNKSYGAYDIRNIYNRHLKIASVISVVIFTAALLSPKIVKLFETKEITKEEFKITEVILAEPPPIDPKTTPPPPPNVEAPPPKIASTKFLPPKIVEDEKVIEEEEPPTQEELKKTNPGEVTQKGESENLNEVIVSGKGGEGESDEILVYVGEMPQFSLGDYRLFLKKHLRYPSRALDKRIQGKVFIKFVVEKDGSITDLKVTKSLGYGCDEEALRVVRMMDRKWSPGKSNGVPVRVYKDLSINFEMPSEEE
jgi:periplasmic protein TonB